MPKVPYIHRLANRTFNINNAWLNEINGLSGWSPAYPQLNGVVGAEWIHLVTVNGVDDPRTLRRKVRFDGPMQPTAALQSSSRLLSLWSNLSIPFENGKIIRIAPGGIIPRHRFQHAYAYDKCRIVFIIQSDTGVSWQALPTSGVEQINVDEGRLSIVDHRLYHQIENNSTSDFIYVIADLDVSDEDRVATL